MEKHQLLLSGAGGQGVITLAILLAETAVIYEARNAIQSQSYGPEARGGATRSDVIISDEEIYYPKVNQPNVLLALTTEAAITYMPLMRPGGIFIYDSDLVTPGNTIDAMPIGLPFHSAATNILQIKQGYNIIVLGALASLTNVVQLSSLEQTLQSRFTQSHWKSNQKALRLGAKMASQYKKTVAH